MKGWVYAVRVAIYHWLRRFVISWRFLDPRLHFLWGWVTTVESVRLLRRKFTLLTPLFSCTISLLTWYFCLSIHTFSEMVLLMILWSFCRCRLRLDSEHWGECIKLLMFLWGSRIFWGALVVCSFLGGLRLSLLRLCLYRCLRAVVIQGFCSGGELLPGILLHRFQTSSFVLSPTICPNWSILWMCFWWTIRGWGTTRPSLSCCWRDWGVIFWCCWLGFWWRACRTHWLSCQPGWAMWNWLSYKILVILKNGDKFHDGVDPDSHGIEVEDVRMLFGVDFIEAFLEHFSFFQIRFLPCILAPGEEDIWVIILIPAWISSSKMEEMTLVLTFC